MKPRASCSWLATLSLALTTVLSIVAAGVLATAPSATKAHAQAELPHRLSDTGWARSRQHLVPPPGSASFTPQYPLWSDGADKRRWLQLPPGVAIDATDPDAWQFPPGTRLWKAFAHAGRPIETRYMERRADGGWLFGSYIWNDDGSDATLAPARGAVLAVPQAPGGRYEVPGRGDCLACHDGAVVPVLGVGALQLSPDRDPLAPHAGPADPADVDLQGLIARGWLRGLPPHLQAQPPRVAARTPLERAALGYLHANCGHCHNANGSPVPVGLVLAQGVADAPATRLRVLASMLSAPSRYRPPGLGAGGHAPAIVAPGQPESSVLRQRMASRHPHQQMPPLGTQLADDEALALIGRWIGDELADARTALAADPLSSDPSLPTTP
jgi:hypothetical protein